MKIKDPPMKTKTVASCCLFLTGIAFLFTASQTGQSKTNDKKPWNPPNAVAAFTAALTRAGYDRDFRNRLTASPESAKQAVSDEGQLIIPNDVAVIFHEDKKEEREKHHAFSLPPLDEKARTTHEYKKYFECCYDVW